MSASKTVKAIGLANLKYVYTRANVKRNTFNRWYRSNRQLFDVVVAGVKAMEPNKIRIVNIRGCRRNYLITAEQLHKILGE